MFDPNSPIYYQTCLMGDLNVLSPPISGKILDPPSKIILKEYMKNI